MKARRGSTPAKDKEKTERGKGKFLPHGGGRTKAALRMWKTTKIIILVAICRASFETEQWNKWNIEL